MSISKLEKIYPIQGIRILKIILSSLKRNVVDWMNRKEFYDRELIVASVRDTISLNGRFICLLGGKSTGKTLLIKYLSQPQHNFKHRCVINLNMRETQGDILKALLSSLLNTRTERVMDKASQIGSTLTNNLFQVLSEVFSQSFGASNPVPEQFQVSDLLEILRKKNVSDSDAIKGLLSRLSLAFGTITVVIDEANLALTPKLRDKARLKKAQDDLDVFTMLSKESTQVNLLSWFVRIIYSFCFT
jgi:Cdc6-like AAA superfamily ATPase